MTAMTTQGKTTKRWRPRFSLRTLVIVLTLICVYFGAWDATKRFGIPAVSKVAETDNGEFLLPVLTADSRLPFCVTVVQEKKPKDRGYPVLAFQYGYRRDYIWIFGWVVHLRDER